MAGDDVKRAFAARLAKLTTERGWNQSDLARHASQHLPHGRTFGRDNISNYFNAKALPTPVHLSALAKALGMAAEDLLPERAVPPSPSAHASTSLTDMGGGYVYLRLNKRLPWPLALDILKMVNENMLAEVDARRIYLPPDDKDEDE